MIIIIKFGSGRLVGASDGVVECLIVGEDEGKLEGFAEGMVLGTEDSSTLGFEDGKKETVGDTDGKWLGTCDGSVVGDKLGNTVGMLEGFFFLHLHGNQCIFGKPVGVSQGSQTFWR